MISIKRSALNMIEPCVARRSKKATLASLLLVTERFRGEVPLFVAPMGKTELVETFYD